MRYILPMRRNLLTPDSLAESSHASVAIEPEPRILLADDQREVRQTVASLLQNDFQIVGMADNGADMLELAAIRSADVLVLDIEMPVLNGIETARRLRASDLPGKIVFLTVYDDADFVEAAMSVGALGYVVKTHLATDLIPAIWRVLEGQIYISPSITYPSPSKTS